MTRPRLLDLFCAEGGAAMGYARAGFEVVGVDSQPMPRYPFEFHQADAMTFPLEGFDAIHASPPCKAFTKTGWAYKFGYHLNHEDLLTPTRERLRTVSVPWVIENVPGAPMEAHAKLCGSQFGLGVRRHRWFEFSWPLFAPFLSCAHLPVDASPHGHPRRADEGATWGPAMGIDWMSTAGLAQAIPPAYTEWIGRQLMAAIERAA